MLRLMPMLTSQSGILSLSLSFRRSFPDLTASNFRSWVWPRRYHNEGCGAVPTSKVIGLDGADAMLEIAGKEILQDSSLANRVDIRKWHIGRQENPLGSEDFTLW